MNLHFLAYILRFPQFLCLYENHVRLQVQLISLNLVAIHTWFHSQVPKFSQLKVEEHMCVYYIYIYVWYVHDGPLRGVLVATGKQIYLQKCVSNYILYIYMHGEWNSSPVWWHLLGHVGRIPPKHLLGWPQVGITIIHPNDYVRFGWVLQAPISYHEWHANAAQSPRLSEPLQLRIWSLDTSILGKIKFFSLTFHCTSTDFFHQVDPVGWQSSVWRNEKVEKLHDFEWNSKQTSMPGPSLLWCLTFQQCADGNVCEALMAMSDQFSSGWDFSTTKEHQLNMYQSKWVQVALTHVIWYDLIHVIQYDII